MLGNHRDHGTDGDDHQEISALAEAEDQAEEIDRQQDVDAPVGGIADDAAERPADTTHGNPGHVDHRAEAEIPGEAYLATALAAGDGFCKLRIGEQEEAQHLLRKCVVVDEGGERSRIEDVAEVYGQHREDNNPHGYVLAEQFDAHQLAGAGIDRRAHQGSFTDRLAIGDGYGSEQDRKGTRRNDDGKCLQRTLGEFGSGHLGNSRVSLLAKACLSGGQTNSADGTTIGVDDCPLPLDGCRRLVEKSQPGMVELEQAG